MEAIEETGLLFVVMLFSWAAHGFNYLSSVMLLLRPPMHKLLDAHKVPRPVVLYCGHVRLSLRR